MGNITKRQKNEVKTSAFDGFDFLSIFDQQFSIDDFDKSIQTGSDTSKSVLSKVRNAVRNAFSELDDDDAYHYEVSMTDELKQAIDSGEVSLVTGKDGLVYAQLRGEKGRFGKPLPIEKHLEEQGLTVEQIELAMQMDAIRAQLESMIETLKTIEGRVTEVIQGQHNDRIGLFYSGLSLYTESQRITSDSLRTLTQANALKALSDANSQVIQEIRQNIEYLVTERYNGSKDITKEIDNRLATINKCYDVVYRSTFLKSTIYYERGEIEAMLTCLDEYGRFIQKLIIPYAGVLSELDKNEKFIEKGTWGAIAKTLSICSEMREKLSASEELLIDMKGD